MPDFQTLTPELKTLAANLAPAIRPRLRQPDGSCPTLSFQPDTGLTVDGFARLAGETGTAGACLIGDASQPLEALTSALAGYAAAAYTTRYGVTGLGTYQVRSDCPTDRPAERPADRPADRSISLPTGRLAGKVSIITGSAQGFGEGIAREMAAQGAYVVIADLNGTQAEQVAADICSQQGAGRATAMKVDVGSEDSVWQMIQDTVLTFGGLDILVSNAGVLKAGGLEEMDLKSFEFVTKINYTAFFLCTKYAARVMKLQHRFDPDWYGDIIQINSKSGLEGSMKNFAYAGSKFGGIGLTQSFAKELVEFKIKVNAVCPGNYYEGPLWSDPVKGLFVQYLNTGKVPGAKTVQDVYDFYVSKVPMKKGCSPRDVARAIFYLVEQVNETGQALPVTGGQNMLH